MCLLGLGGYQHTPVWKVFQVVCGGREFRQGQITRRRHSYGPAYFCRRNAVVNDLADDLATQYLTRWPWVPRASRSTLPQSKAWNLVRTTRRHLALSPRMDALPVYRAVTAYGLSTIGRKTLVSM